MRPRNYGGGRLNQTRLSFSLVPRPETKPEEEGDQRVINTRILNTRSEGHKDSTAVTRAGINCIEKDQCEDKQA